jgi:hypothetical protein
MWLLTGSSVLRGAFDVGIQPFVWSWVCEFLYTTGRCFQTSLLGWSHRMERQQGSYHWGKDWRELFACTLIVSSICLL